MNDDEARAILREHGEDPPARGRLAPAWKEKAAALRADAGPPPPDDYEPGVSGADFGTVIEAGEPPAPVRERRPRRVKGARPSLGARIRGGQDKPGRPKKRHPRVPVDGLISSAWAAMGGLAGQIDPPLGRCLIMQAPVSGLILEDVVKDTVADRALQPIARAEEKAEKVLALVGPPLLVAALEASAGLPEKQMMARRAVIVPLLERSMVLWVRIAGDKIDQQMARHREEGPAKEKARELLTLIFGPDPTPGATSDQPQTETVGA